MGGHDELGTCVEDFYRLKDEGKILFGTLIRVYHYGTSSSDEKYYVVGENGLYHPHSDDDVVFKPEDILSTEVAPNKWGVERRAMCCLPDSEILPYLEKN